MSAANNKCGLKQQYLIAYNGVQFLGWSFVLGRTLVHFCRGGFSDYAGLWDYNEVPVKIFQTTMALEVMHAATGIVPSGVVVTALQIASRLLVVWGIAHIVPESHDTIGVPLIMMTWGITESLRYSYYLSNLLGHIPRQLQWCRYTFFIILYPSGVTGELLMMLAALPFIRERNTLGYNLPNRSNISFDYFYFLVLVMATYAPVFPQLYGHMFSQRRKVLRSVEKFE